MDSTFKKLRSWHPVPSFQNKQKGKNWKQWHILFSWALKSLWALTTVMKFCQTHTKNHKKKKKDASWKESYDKPRQCIKKQRHHFANRDPYSQSYGFSSSHVRMWELYYKEGCVLNHFSLIRLCTTLWTAAHQAPLSMGFSRQEYQSGLLCPSPGDLLTQVLNPSLLYLLHWQAGSLPHATWETQRRHWRNDASKLWCWRRLLRVPWTARRSNQSILKEINPESSLKGLVLKLQYFGHPMWRAGSLAKTLMLGKTEGKKSGRGQDGWMTLLIQWTWVWANSRIQWRTRKGGVLQ